MKCILEKKENIECIESVSRFDVTGSNGETETVCYAAKVTTDFFVLPYITYID